MKAGKTKAEQLLAKIKEIRAEQKPRGRQPITDGTRKVRTTIFVTENAINRLGGERVKFEAESAVERAK